MTNFVWSGKVHVRGGGGVELESGTGQLVLSSYKDIRVLSRQGQVSWGAVAGVRDRTAGPQLIQRHKSPFQTRTGKLRGWSWSCVLSLVKDIRVLSRQGQVSWGAGAGVRDRAAGPQLLQRHKSPFQTRTGKLRGWSWSRVLNSNKDIRVLSRQGQVSWGAGAGVASSAYSKT